MTGGRFAPGWLAAALCALTLAACSPRFDWREVRPPGAGFVVALPDRPHTVTREVAFGGRTIPMSMTSTGIGPTLFAVGVAELPGEAVEPQQVQSTLEWFRDALVRNVGATLLRSEPAAPPAGGRSRALRAAITVEARGSPRADGRPTVLAARFFVADDRLYQVVAFGAEGEIPPAVLQTFFDSFQLIH